MTPGKRFGAIVGAIVVFFACLAVYTQYEATNRVKDQASLNAERNLEVAVPYSADLLATSPTLHAFFESAAWDPFVVTFEGVDEAGAAIAAENAAQCERAKTDVWMPPWAGQVDAACAQIRASEKAAARAHSFVSVGAAYTAVCTGTEDENWTTPFDAEQWKTLDALITRAVAADCR